MLNNKIAMKLFYLIFFFINVSIVHSQDNIFDVCRNGSIEEITKLYKANSNIINKKNDQGYTPLILACYHGNESIVTFLIDKVDDINGSSEYGTPLMAAVVKGNKKITKLLLDKKAKTNIADANGTTALHYATLFKKNEIAKLLVEAGANYNLKDGNNKSAYDYALNNNNKELLTLFKK
ncbi:ankyrin repeat domain-containing protein [Algibacter marinivivus]|uniref:Ankyrin repeat domain-containing protein n=2 Tax=Algibacter marinivivus TaxID=2100723 RepID=A0A2U2X5T5_9FLAO|nr:ankyrin repeat domain-containing protein [Algibacter marinivivus]